MKNGGSRKCSWISASWWIGTGLSDNKQPWKSRTGCEDIALRLKCTPKFSLDLKFPWSTARLSWTCTSFAVFYEGIKRQGRWWHHSEVGGGALGVFVFPENLCCLVLDTHSVQSDSFSRHFILPGGTLEPRWVAAFWLNAFLRGIDFQRGKVTCRKKKEKRFLLLSRVKLHVGRWNWPAALYIKRAGIEISCY